VVTHLDYVWQSITYSAAPSGIKQEEERHLVLDQLTLFGLFAVTAMLVCYALKDRSPWFILALRLRARLGQLTAFFKVHGPLVWSKPFGLSLQFDGGDWQPNYNESLANQVPDHRLEIAPARVSD
jgi:hypothetical protein